MILIDPKPRVIKVAPLSPKPSLAERRSKRAKAIESLSPEARELIEIRHSLGLSQEKFANKLGVLFSLIASYEYGRTERVRPEVLEKARALRK